MHPLKLLPGRQMGPTCEEVLLTGYVITPCKGEAAGTK